MTRLHTGSTRFHLLCLGLLSLGMQVSATTDLGKIWPLGDSITFGTVPGGYREPLYTNLAAKGYAFTFVGTTTLNSSTLLTSAGQNKHNGHVGYTIADCIIASSPPRPYSGLYDEVLVWHNTLASQSNSPDIILLLIGINDLNQKYDVAGAPDRLEPLVTRLFTLMPNVRILISSLLDADLNNPYRHVPPNTDLLGPISDYNAAIASMVSTRRALGQNIEFVDMHAGLTLAIEDLSDGLHPTQAGYVKMANIWTDAIIANPPNFTSNAINASAGTVSLSATGGLGTSYSFWASTNLAPEAATNTWTLLTSGNIVTNPFTITDTTTNAQRFYRFSAP